MAEKINLRSSKVKEQKRRVSEYGTETPLPSTAVERGTTRWLNGSTVVIEGLLDVTGTTQISGRLDVSGATTLSGVTTIAGPTGITGALTIQGVTTISGQLDVTGPTKLAGTLDITGNTNITGTLGIKGDTTLTGNMDVTGGGKITVGNTRLSPSASNGGVEFVSGGGIGGNAGGVLMRGSGNAGFLANATALASMFGGASQIDVSGTDVKIAAPLINLNAPQTSVNGKLVVTGTSTLTGDVQALGNLKVGTPFSGSMTPNVYMDANGWLYRTSWKP